MFNQADHKNKLFIQKCIISALSWQALIELNRNSYTILKDSKYDFKTVYYNFHSM